MMSRANPSSRSSRSLSSMASARPLLRWSLGLTLAAVLGAACPQAAAAPPAAAGGLGAAEAARLVAAWRDGPLVIAATGIDAAAAAVLAGWEGELVLDDLGAISPEVATALAAHRGPLSLSGLRSLPADAAARLSGHASVLWLDGLRTLLPETAAALASHRGPLVLDGVTVLSPQAASFLASHTHWLSLGGLADLDPLSARALAGHGGPLSLDGLAFLAPDAARELARLAHPLSLGGLVSVLPATAVELEGHAALLSLPRLESLSAAVAAALARHLGPLDLPGVRSLSYAAYAALAGSLDPRAMAAVSLGGAPANEKASPPAAGTAAPALPEVGPADLLAYAEELRLVPVRPRTQSELRESIRGTATAVLQAADRIVAQTAPDDPLHAQAAALRLESLVMLGRLGDEQAAAAFEASAQQLAESGSPGLARLADRMLLMTAGRAMLAKADLAAGETIIDRLGGLLAARPDDAELAGIAIQLAGRLEQLPAGKPLAIRSQKTFGPVLAKSGERRIRQAGEIFAARLRRLALPGRTMEIGGTLLDGSPFDHKSLAGKVVLVDFWATWSGPSLAELPAVLAAYAKYHDRGFEVVGVSVDDDRHAVERFVTEKNVPWPILHEQPAGPNWRHPLARQYGIHGVPRFVLIGRDGKVIAIDAGWSRLGEKLAALFAEGG
jgi:thiol-disulfide isomerase/thioredoxin